MRATVLAQPAPPSQPLPPEVTEPLDQLLGYGMWIVGAVLVTSLITAGGMLWWLFATSTPLTRTVRKILWILAAAIAASSAGALAGFALS
ncbi:hypothetical protein AYK61_26075 [Rhodococcus sp. SBT000017]|jgi:hypothetical protein|uniref:hypothetical protein n=1 Tax=Rhodococcus sp. SBT000017 TaxID=1803385 RepID=UPI000EF882ED|nr:hypothetical protein [Rhodococcus sp. SBT000017]RMB70204.1 hypothetical protein AYK61_26075 [Rhodococcus sp. SBT000017]